ncbi:hypothetical protein CRH09_15355 [Nocardia terpenica]|uniref:Uncharacterized protein n=2 Tax=Nocardia terpenica TaxID=455432 RepID=A0A291RJB2_9NOCA|nr:hypothetical protein CRH09_15355 [Nocardia terpenica]
MSWHLDDLQVRVTEEWWRNWRGPDGVAPNASLTLSPGEFFRNVVRFDHIDELVVQAADPNSSSTHLSYTVVLHDLGYLMNWYNVARGRKDDRHVGMRGLAIDVTDTNPPVISPNEVLDLTSGTSTASTRGESWSTERLTDDDGPAAALLAWSPRLRVPVVAQWISKVPSWIDWERKGDPMVFHPDDCEALRRTFETLSGGDEIATVAGLRAFTDSGWQLATVTSRRYPGEIGDRLHIIRIAKAQR